MHPETQPVSTETLLRVVADPKRREILEQMRAFDDGDVTLEQLSETFVPHGQQGDSDDRSARSAIELRHTHLPMLADAELVAYDPVHDTVTYRDDERAEALLAFITERLE